jgi:phospholipid transport system transporter-binding protein
VKVDVASVTSENAAKLLDQGLAAIRGGDLTIDLTDVKIVDSAAVALLLAWQRAAAEQGKRATFTGVPSGVVSLAELYGVNALLQLGPTPA